MKCGLFDFAARNDSGECVGELVQDHLGDICALCTRDVAVADTVLGDDDVVTQASAVSGGRRYADMSLK